MVMRNYGPTWADRTRNYARNSIRPITGRIMEERAKALRIDTGIRTAWLPKALVTYDREKGVFYMPSSLAAEKLLD